MRDVVDEISRAAAAGEPVAVATVVAARNGSAPRPVGSKLAVTAGGRLVGSVSGGCVEADVAERAKDVLAGGDPALLTYGIADEEAWSVGLPCGSEIDVWLERADPELWERVGEIIEREKHAVLSTDLGTGEKRLELGAATVTGVEDGVFAERIAPPLRLLVFGATDIAEALCALGGTLGWRTVVSDPRPGLATPERVPSAAELHVGWPDEALELVDDDTAVVVLTHEERLDLPALEGALRRGARYVGALGSRRVQERRRAQLAEHGLGDDEIARMSGPAGLDLGGRAPAEIALSIAAEIVATVAGKTTATTKGSPQAPRSQPLSRRT
jgi:xanthine dehydrogenase accessory factor